MEKRDKDAEDIQVKQTVCWPSPGCQDRCKLKITVKDGRILKAEANKESYSKGAGAGCGDRLPHFKKWQYDSGQLMYPLKRIGERGENKWERVSWDSALDDIAERLKRLKDEFGAESLAITEGTGRSDIYGIRTRFLNLFGNPSNIGDPGTVCVCNKAALMYALAGTNSVVRREKIAKCYVLSGMNLSGSFPHYWRRIKQRRQEIKLIVIDPRKTECAEDADIWIQLRPGTDTALYMAWINVIIEERLFDEEFVKNWTFGFDELRQRAAEYTPEKVAAITWVPSEKIVESARMYATNTPGIFNYSIFGCATDQLGLNGMRANQAQMCLRAITGNMSNKGCEPLSGPGPIIKGQMVIRDSMLQLEEKCPPEQRSKQLGADRYKLMTWPAFEIIDKYYRKVYGIPLCMSGHNFLAAQPLIWRAILTGKPYPIKAMITWTSNPLLNAANTKVVYKALKSPNLDLHVILEHWMTPTALLADYVLPAAAKFEKPMFDLSEDFTSVIICGERAIKPMGERRTDYDFFRELAIRLGFGEYFPWATEEELADYRLSPLGIDFEEAATKRHNVYSDEPPWLYDTINPKTGEPTGFATPSGKLELYSNVLKELGYDPLPFYEEPPESPMRTPDIFKDYPLILITGGKFRPMFHSENRKFGLGIREQHPDPLMDIHPDTAKELDICEGDWAYIETRRGVIKQRARLNTGIDPRVVNIESHWWFPEQPAQEPWLHGVWQSNANVLTTDDPETLDPISGGWPVRALLCKVYK